MASASTDPAPPSTITLRSPSRYASATSSSSFLAPPLEWIYRSWSVTHSTLSMWRSARNVRITYSPLPDPATSGGSAGARSPRIDDLVEYEAADGKGGVKRVTGVDTATSPSDTGSWDWRGKGWLFFVTSHWELLGWGERPLSGGSGGGGNEVERWAVTWFAPTLFTKEGVDIYSDRKEGPSKETAEEIIAALKSLDAKPVVQMCEKDLRPVGISLPWKEK